MHRLACCVLLLASLAAGACSNPVTTTAPTTATSTVSESFTGTLNKNGATTYAFSAAVGTITATVTTLAPDSTLVVGLSLGTWNGTACQVVLANDKATQGSTVTGSASATGTLCVRIYDVGLVGQPATFQVDVIHF